MLLFEFTNIVLLIILILKVYLLNLKKMYVISNKEDYLHTQKDYL